MRFADCMAYPLPQHEMIEQKGLLKVDDGILLDVCHTTSVPPYLTSMDEILRYHSWFVGVLGNQDNMARPACFFGIQHPPQGATVQDLFILKGIGIRFMTLAYNGANEYGGGFATPEEPLSSRGRELVEAMSETGIVLDLSHAGHCTARDAMDFVRERALKVRVVATHTACFDLHDHGRGFPDDVLIDIRELGGFVGLVTVTWMLHASDDSMTPFFCHLKHLVELVGEDHVCLGTDGVYQFLDPVEEKRRFEIMEAKINPDGTFRTRFPEQAPELNSPHRLAVIEEGLRSLEWPSAIIEKIMGENLIEFLSSL